VEYAFAPNWSFGVEYNHLFMGTENYNFRGVGVFAGVNTRNDDIKQDADIVTARINYRFGGPAVARY
jgi:outer membrane immunogenic protein